MDSKWLEHTHTHSFLSKQRKWNYIDKSRLSSFALEMSFLTMQCITDWLTKLVASCWSCLILDSLKRNPEAESFPPKRTAWNQPKAGWTGTYVQSTLTHIIHTWLQTVWTLANDVVVNVRWCCFFLRASEPSSCTAQHKALCTVITTAKEINDFVCNFLCFYSNVIALLFSYPFPPFIWQLLQGMCSDDPCSHASSTVLVPWCSVTSEMGGLCLITFPSCQSLTARVPWSLNV